ncbi:hypothetical protein WICMUC_000754 [Wickerhamomyces mucosus]|uniref:Peroxin-7 n=1 Tax=Wickerhamomyces mucosus TaxID=1378264 RepID=A0A9P8PWH9_9ASCO|nr:hypothetical protein WICMUC_000754 [Wickerhamomyces mucosus]
MLQFRTRGYSGYAVKYSPFYDNKLAVATSANYGLVGNGRLYILSIQPNGEIVNDISFDTQDGLFDLSWSETHSNHILTANGDGSLKLFDIKINQFPIMQWKEHQRESFSTNWNLIDKTTFLSSSWDGTVKLWSSNSSKSILTLNTFKPGFKQNCCYQAIFSPHNKDLITSINSNGFISIFDLRQPQPLISEILAHNGAEILTCDWNKYKPTIIATGSVDKSIKIWDLRMVSTISDQNSSTIPINQLIGHEFAVKKVIWSPHDGNELMSCSYDMTCRIWQNTVDLNYKRGKIKQKIFNGHKEFCMGGDYSLWGEPGWCSTTGWDEMVYIFDSKRL